MSLWSHDNAIQIKEVDDNVKRIKEVFHYFYMIM
jgi:hypothetical protein